MPEGHFVFYAGHSNNSGVLGNGRINTFLYYRSTLKRRALLS